MSLYNINVASGINAAFVTHYERFNCNICHTTARDFIYTQNISFTVMKGRGENFHIFLPPLFPFQNRNLQYFCVRKIRKKRREVFVVLL